MICLVCAPTHLRIGQPINSFQREWFDDPPDALRAAQQHRELVKALERLAVRVVEVPVLEGAPYQVFMRDVLIAGLDVPVVGRMREPVRRPEIDQLMRTLEEVGIASDEAEGGYLEGGDVVVNGRDVFVGLGDRTERGASEWLGGRFAGYRIHPLEMQPGFLHLDMVFNVFSPTSCVYCPAGLTASAVADVRRRFENCLEIDSADQRRMSTNFLPVGDAAIIAPASATPAVLDAARAEGREVLTVDLSEIQKTGGSVRCSTCLIE